MSSKIAAAATEPAAAQAVVRMLDEGATSADAVLSGFFAAAGERPGVLLGSLEVLLGGPGVGARAFDGRPRQPGRGVARPRGFVDGQPIPGAARVAVPCALAGAGLLHAYAGKLPFSRLMRAGVERASAQGATARAELLERMGRRAGAALADPPLARALLTLAGRAEHGLVTEADLVELRPASAAPVPFDLGARVGLVSPWFEEPEIAEEGARRPFEVVTAVDSRGTLAILAYRPDDDGLRLDDLGIAAPRDAVPVRRGVVRVAPGTPLGPAAPLLLLMESAVPVIGLGLRGPGGLGRGGIPDSLGQSSFPVAAPLREWMARAGATAAAAVIRSPGDGRASAMTIRSDEPH